MQQRPIAYTLEQIYSADFLNGQVYSLIGDANDLQVTLGQTGSYISNLLLSPTSPASLTLNLTNGFLASLQPVDASAYGSLTATTQQVMQLAFNNQTNVVINNTLEAGQAQYVLIEVGFQQQDSDAIVLNYVNLSNPAVPLSGPGNSGIAQDTIRNEVAIITVKYGTPATSGSEVPPVVDAGNVAIAYIDLEAAQVTITSGQILDPTAVYNETGHGSPTQILAGLLNSHHDGEIGQAPPISLDGTGTSRGLKEVQGLLHLINMYASNTVGAVASFRTNAGNPNGVLAGNANVNGASDFAYDTTNLLLYVCTTTGSSSSAVWTSVAAPLPNNIVYFGGGNNLNNRTLPTSGTITGEYYVNGAWVQSGPITSNYARIHVNGSMTINSTWTINTEFIGGAPGNGMGVYGTATGQSGGGPGGSTSAFFSTSGGGAGHGGVGGNSQQSSGGAYAVKNAGLAYSIYTLLCGSSAAGGAGNSGSGGAGGNGGGSLYIEATGTIALTSTAAITGNGGDGAGPQNNVDTQGGGGGGSGSGIQMRSYSGITIASGATITANGGAGGNGQTSGGNPGGGGGGGGGGIVDLTAPTVTNNGTISVSGGAGGTSASSAASAQAGGTGVVNLNSYTLGIRTAN